MIIKADKKDVFTFGQAIDYVLNTNARLSSHNLTLFLNNQGDICLYDDICPLLRIDRDIAKYIWTQNKMDFISAYKLLTRQGQPIQSFVTGRIFRDSHEIAEVTDIELEGYWRGL